MKIEINYNGSIAVCTVDGKAVNKLSSLEIAQLFSAFKCVEKDAHYILEGKYKITGTIYKSSSKNITKV